MINLTDKEKGYLDIEILNEKKDIYFSGLIDWMERCNKYNEIKAFLHQRYETKKDLYKWD